MPANTGSRKERGRGQGQSFPSPMQHVTHEPGEGQAEEMAEGRAVAGNSTKSQVPEPLVWGWGELP